MTEREFHPAAEIFPMIDERDFESLVADIGTHGLKVEIVLCDDKILDGRNRYRACQKAGVEPRFTRYEGDDPLSYVLSLNLRRRHLDKSQLAMIAAKAADMRKLERLENPATLPVLTQPEVADRMGVSERSVRTAKKVLDHGPPELIKKVEQGEISVFKAADAIQNKQTDRKTRVAADVQAARVLPKVPIPYSNRMVEALVLDATAAKCHLEGAMRMARGIKHEMSRAEVDLLVQGFYAISVTAGAGTDEMMNELKARGDAA